MGFNKIIFLGNLTHNVELRYTPSGTPVGSFGLAVNRRFKQGDELKEEVCFIDVVVFGKQAENGVKYLAKGSKVLIEGRLQQRRWETETGDKRSKHEVVAETITYLDGTNGHGTEQAGKKSDDGLTMEWERKDA